MGESTTAPAGSGATDGLRLESFAPGLDDAGQAADARTRHWFDAVDFGFHEERTDASRLPALTRAYQRDGRILTAVYDDAAPEHAWDPAVPVATYASMVNDLNVGGTLLPAHLVTAVTVRPTHRRRGILRRMITADLAAAKAAGRPLAALTASEATIYGRFGFGAATSTAQIQVDTRGGLDFRAAAAGTVAVADARKLEALAPGIFRAHLQRTFGALGRQHSYALRASGAWGEESTEPDKAVRGVIRYDSHGVADGYAAYKSLGWQTEPHTLKVIDLVAATDEAYRELWRYLGAVDLVERLTFGVAPVEDPLPWMLTNRRRYKVTGIDDVLWLRVLDVPGALQARGYFADGAVLLDVADPLGAAAGSWLLEARGGTAVVSPAADGDRPDVPRAALDVSALGSLYLGAVSARTLASAGSLRAAEDALDVLDAMFSAGPAPYCSTHF